MFIAALFITAKKNKPNDPQSTDEQIYKIWYTHTME